MSDETEEIEEGLAFSAEGHQYNVFEIKITDRHDKTKAKAAQVGGGQFSGEDMDRHLRKFNLFPGAKEIEITPTNVTAGTIQSAEKRLMAMSGGKVKPLTTPKAKINTAKILKSALKQTAGVPVSRPGEPDRGQTVGGQPVAATPVAKIRPKA